jgi:hypothetical protein
LTYVSISTRRGSWRNIALELGTASERWINTVVAAFSDRLALAIVSVVVITRSRSCSGHGGSSEEEDAGEELHFR